MKKLLSLPPNLVECFHEVTGLSRDEFFCTNDPVGHRLGSGGGTTWLLQQAHEWLKGERCIVLQGTSMCCRRRCSACATVAQR